MHSSSALHDDGLVAIADGKAVTTSKQVALFFGKPHSKVLLGIDLIQMELPLHCYDPHFLLIAPGIRRDGRRDARARIYRMTFEGFMLLAVAFTRKTTRPFMLMYLEQFIRIEQTLLHRAPPDNTGGGNDHARPQ